MGGKWFEGCRHKTSLHIRRCTFQTAVMDQWCDIGRWQILPSGREDLHFGGSFLTGTLMYVNWNQLENKHKNSCRFKAQNHP